MIGARDTTLRVNVDATTSAASSKLGAFGGVARKAALGVALVGAAAIGVGAKLFEIGDAAGDSNDRIGAITKSMGLFGKQTEAVTQRIIDQANATAIATGIDQNQIKATQAKLLTFKELAKSADEMGGNFDRATVAAVDMAAAGFGTAEANATQLGKALNDPVKGLTALAKSGVTFTEQEKARIATLVESNRMGEAQALVLKAIETQVGGTAEAMAGGFDRIKIRASQLAETVGLKLAPQVDRFATFLLDKGIPAATILASRLRERLGPAFAKVGDFITTKAVPAARSFLVWFQDKIVPGIVKYLTPVLVGAQKAFGKVAEKVRDNEPELRKLFEAFKKVAEFVADKVMPIVGKALGKQLENMGTAIGVAISVIAGIVTAFEKIYNAVKDVIGAVESLIGWLKKIDIPDIDIPGVGRASAGGAVAGRSAADIRNGGAGTTNLYFTITDPMDAPGILRLLRRHGVALGGTVGG